MPAKKPSISLATAGLETAAPAVSTPDLTEHRTRIRRFPKDAGERECYQYLLEQMQLRRIALVGQKPNSRRPADGDFM